MSSNVSSVDEEQQEDNISVSGSITDDKGKENIQIKKLLKQIAANHQSLYGTSMFQPNTRPSRALEPLIRYLQARMLNSQKKSFGDFIFAVLVKLYAAKTSLKVSPAQRKCDVGDVIVDGYRSWCNQSVHPMWKHKIALPEELFKIRYFPYGFDESKATKDDLEADDPTDNEDDEIQIVNTASMAFGLKQLQSLPSAAIFSTMDEQLISYRDKIELLDKLKAKSISAACNYERQRKEATMAYHNVALKKVQNQGDQYLISQMRKIIPEITTEYGPTIESVVRTMFHLKSCWEKANKQNTFSQYLNEFVGSSSSSSEELQEIPKLLIEATIPHPPLPENYLHLVTDTEDEYPMEYVEVLYGNKNSQEVTDEFKESGSEHIPNDDIEILPNENEEIDGDRPDET